MYIYVCYECVLECIYIHNNRCVCVYVGMYVYTYIRIYLRTYIGACIHT